MSPRYAEHTSVQIRIAANVSRWERLIEWVSWRGQPVTERWEWMDDGGVWRRYWRRNGSMPKGVS